MKLVIADSRRALSEAIVRVEAKVDSEEQAEEMRNHIDGIILIAIELPAMRDKKDNEFLLLNRGPFASPEQNKSECIIISVEHLLLCFMGPKLEKFLMEGYKTKRMWLF